MKKGVLFFLLSVLVIPSAALAHPEPIKTEVMYTQKVSIESVTIDDDHNWFGSADIFFDTEVEAVAPPHETQSYITDGTLEIDSGQTLEFDPPYEIYSHDTCHCDEEFDIDIAVFDHVPIKTIAYNLLEKGFDYLLSYLQGGETSVMISVIGDVLDLLIDALMKSGMSEEEAEYQAYVDLIEESDHLGSMRHIISTPCEPADASYEGDLEIEEVTNGSIKYKIEKIPLEIVCVYEEPEVGHAGDPDPEDEPVGRTPDPLTPPLTDPEEESEPYDDNPEPEEEEESEPESEPEPEDEPTPEPESEPDTEPESDPGPTDSSDDEPTPVPDDTPTDDSTDSDDDSDTEEVTYDCLGATRLAIDWGTGYYDPAVVSAGSNLYYWFVGPFACKSADAVQESYTSGITDGISTYSSMCPSLYLKSASANDTADGCGIDYYFAY